MYLEIEEEYGTYNYRSHPIILSHGEGIFVFDINGKKYVDFTAGMGACAFGHCNEYLTKALNDQALKLTMCSRAYHNDQTSKFLKTLCSMTKMDKAMPLNTGVEAVEAMVKACRLFGYKVKNIEKDKAEIIVMKGSYHGRTIGTISFTDTEVYRKNFGPLLPGIVMVPFNDFNAIEKAITKNTCAIITEPIQGEGGVIIPNNDWLKNVRRLCDENKILLAIDEVQSGMGRTGHFMAHEAFGVKADLVAFGKSLGGGILPVSALVGNKEVMSLFELGSHGSTFGGNPLAMRIGYESIKLTEKLMTNVKKLSPYLKERLLKLPHIKEVRCFGFWAGLKVVDSIKAKDISLHLLETGVLIKDGRDNTLRLFPPFVITKEEIEHSFNLIENCLNDL